MGLLARIKKEIDPGAVYVLTFDAWLVCKLLNWYRLAKQICVLTHSALRMDGDNQSNE